MIIISNLEIIGKFLLFECIFSLLSWPVTSRLFGGLSDKGYSLAKIFGWVVVSYISFASATVKIIPLPNSWLVLGFWLALNLYFEARYRVIRQNWKSAFFPQLIFTTLFCFWAYVRGHQPEIYQIERFMDFATIQSLLKSNFLPLEDFWQAGTFLNYYYFGLFVGSQILRFTLSNAVSGFYLLICWGFAVLGLNVYQLAKNISGSVRAGLLSLFAVNFAGTAYSLWWIKNGSGWYPDPTRAIKGTIMELPLYSFLVADNHAHVWGLIFAIVFLTCLWLYYKKTASALPLFFLLGIAIMTNTWDFLFLSIPIGFILFFRKKFAHFLLFLTPFLVSLPWLYFFKTPVGGIGIVKSPSDPVLWLAHWGIFLGIVIAGLLVTRFNNNDFIKLLLSSAIFLLVFIEIFYFVDVLKDGEWFRANTTFKATIQIWLWLGVLFGPAIMLILKNVKPLLRIFLTILIYFILLLQAYFPYKALWQSTFEGRKFTGLETGLSWWKNKYPDDYAAYEFLKSVPERPVILEAEGESYTDTSRFSTFLGWPTVIGWAVHEWTWNGKYDLVGAKGAEVREVYTGYDLAKAQ